LLGVRCLRRLAALSIVALAAAAAVSPGRADELTLKNGKKVVGTIVGYEHDMFRVETDYGMALVRKDKVASIKISASEDPTTKGAKDTTGKVGKDAVAKVEKDAAGNGGNSTLATPPPASNRLQQVGPVRPLPTPAEPPPAPADSSRPAPPPPKPAPPPVSHVVDEPLSAHLQEHVDGNTYVNDTFQFAMFKPPDWKVYEEVPRETGSGITAIGTEDEQTLLIVDRQVWSGVPDLKSDEAEARLRRTYQDFQKLSEEPGQCDGRPAVRTAFQGVLDGVEWHGVAVHVARGNTVFGIIGLTSAEMYQFQQAVLNKVINSFHFLPASSEAPAKPSAGAT
jgi:hypothetical protein